MQGLVDERVTMGQASAAQPPLVAGPLPPMPRPGRNWTVEHRPLAACQDIIPAWSALGRRALAENPCFEPGFLLPAAQHLVAFRDVSVLLVWKAGPAGREPQLVGLMPYRRVSRVLRSDVMNGMADPRLVCDWPLLDRDAAGPALSAMLRAIGAEAPVETNWRLRGVGMDNPLIPVVRGVRRGAAASAEPLRGMLAADGAEAPSGRFTLRDTVGLPALRDGVEILMALEASGAFGRAGKASLQNTREAAFLRAMTRQQARAKLCQISLLLDDSEPVAAALTLGRGKRRWLYKIAAAGSRPEGPEALSGQLVSAMRQATPGLQLLSQGDRSVGDAVSRVSDIVLLGHEPRRPADLARKLRARLDRALFRPRPLAAGE